MGIRLLHQKTPATDLDVVIANERTVCERALIWIDANTRAVGATTRLSAARARVQAARRVLREAIAAVSKRDRDRGDALSRLANADKLSASGLQGDPFTRAAVADARALDKVRADIPSLCEEQQAAQLAANQLRSELLRALDDVPYDVRERYTGAIARVSHDPVGSRSRFEGWLRELSE